MKIELKDGKLCFHPEALIDCLDDEGKADIIERLACDDAIIKAVSEQIITGWTECGSHGGKSCSEDATPSPLDAARRAVALASGDVAAEEIETLRRRLLAKTAKYEELSLYAWNQYHNFGGWCPMDATNDKGGE